MVERRMLSDFLKRLGFLDEEESADALGKTVRTLENWRQQRIGPAYTILGPEGGDGKRSGQVIYHKDWLRDYLIANKKVPVRSREIERATGDDGGNAHSRPKHRPKQREPASRRPQVEHHLRS
jgi:hypothetical protein